MNETYRWPNSWSKQGSCWAVLISRDTWEAAVQVRQNNRPQRKQSEQLLYTLDQHKTLRSSRLANVRLVA